MKAAFSNLIGRESHFGVNTAGTFGTSKGPMTLCHAPDYATSCNIDARMDIGPVIYFHPAD
jgi:hypothetical protein